MTSVLGAWPAVRAWLGRANGAGLALGRDQGAWPAAVSSGQLPGRRELGKRSGSLGVCVTTSLGCFIIKDVTKPPASGGIRCTSGCGPPTLLGAPLAAWGLHRCGLGGSWASLLCIGILGAQNPGSGLHGCLML